MTTARTLPIRIPPLEGEALDSWLEAIAYATHTSYGQILKAVGLPTGHSAGKNRSWIVQLTNEQAASLVVATGCGRTRLESMTLSTHHGRSIRSDNVLCRSGQGFLWGQVRRSRFCPKCLADNHGRWHLKWRLRWTFACTTHHCLLADTCPECGSGQRDRFFPATMIPQPGGCHARDLMAGTHQRCRGDLSAADTMAFPADHAVVEAQLIVDKLIASEVAAFGVYANRPQPPMNALADIRALAFAVISHGTPYFFRRLVPTDLLEHFHLTVRHGNAKALASSVTGSRPYEPVPAATAAVGTVAALAILARPEIASAAQSLSLLTATGVGDDHRISRTKLQCGVRATPILAGIRLAAIKPVLTPVEQLRYRIGSPLLTAGAQALSAADSLSRVTPTMLWPGWALRLATPRNLLRHFRAALSVTVQLVDSTIDVAEACRLIDSPLNESAARHVVRSLAGHEQWCDIREALYRMGDYLRENLTPIDYQRRRRIDYSDLLPDDVWAQICRDMGYETASAPRARAVRRFLFERLSGMPADMAPYADNITHPLRATIEFPGWLTTELADALRDHSQEFLRARNINDEPPFWEPPAALLGDLDLPGTNLDKVDTSPLSLIAAGPERINRVAAELDISSDAARYLVEKHLALPPAWVSGTAERPWHEGSYRVAKTKLPPKVLADLHIQQKISLVTIAASLNVRRDVIANLAEEYGLRPVESTPKRRPELHWLFDQYVFEQRNLTSIASDAGLSARTVAAHAHKCGIPPKNRREYRRQPTVDPKTLSPFIPQLLWPALSTAGGWTRLRRFASAAQYPSLRAAARSLNIHSTALGKQIAQIEQELGAQLLVRAAPGGYPMALTETGSEVVRAVAQTESQRTASLQSGVTDAAHHRGSQNVGAVTDCRSGGGHHAGQVCSSEDK